jgi:diacylglycerol kinase family enzyme
MGIIPCGTGNDFASALNLPKDPVDALDVIIDGKPKFTDFMQLPGVRGLNVVGTGIDVDVLKRYEKKKRKSKWAYTSCLIKTLFNFDYTDFEAQTDEGTKSYRSFIAAVANGHRFGGGVEICPPATPTDGLLNFVAVDELPPLKIVGAFLKLKKGKLLQLPGAHHILTKKIVVSPTKPCTINVDGELYENVPFEIEVVSNTLKVYRP